MARSGDTEWLQFRQQHGHSPTQFIQRWQAMYGVEPPPHALEQYINMFDRLRKAAMAKRKNKAAEQVTITYRYEWDMGHRLPNHEGQCFRLHGHRYVMEIEVTGPVQEDGPAAGMVMDFADIKQAIDDSIGHWDHRCMLYMEDPLREHLSEHQAEWLNVMGIISVPFMPTAENIAREALAWLRSTDLNVTRLRLWETPKGSAIVVASKRTTI